MQYFDNHAISRSALMEFKKSPAHYYQKYIIDKNNDEFESDALKFGRAFHCAILEPDKFQKDYIISPNFDRRTKPGKLDYQLFLNINSNKILLNEIEYNQIIGMRNALIQKKLAQYIFNLKPLCEHEIYWIDHHTKLDCKAKLDMLLLPCEHFPYGLIIDLKTTTDANPNNFIKSIYKYGYYNQVAWYCESVKSSLGLINYPDFLFVNIEKSKPYESSFLWGYNRIEGDNSILDTGLKENTKLLRQLAECKTNNNYEGYPDMALPMGLSEWQIKQVMENL